MQREMLKSKIHRATITHANLQYEGSVTIDADLLDAADLIENEMVHIWNVTCGSRLQTYALRGDRGSGVICLNGAAARLCAPGDKVIIASFVHMEDTEAKKHEPRLVFVDDQNRIVPLNRKEIPGPRLVSGM
ncbi:MAG: Aspartate 1-decarboxylase [Myxococcota bacterium]|nr:Aspartate 1-decarboxylase [Myxococcota bacterium]